MTQNKTQPTGAGPEAFFAAIDDTRRRDEAEVLDGLFRQATGFQPVMWGASIVGYGRYHYRYESGREGEFLATGFSPRKSKISIYIMPGYADFSDLLKDLGKHKIGKSCLYINKLSDIDLSVLTRLVQAGLTDLGQKWPVYPV